MFREYLAVLLHKVDPESIVRQHVGPNVLDNIGYPSKNAEIMSACGLKILSKYLT